MSYPFSRLQKRKDIKNTLAEHGVEIIPRGGKVRRANKRDLQFSVLRRVDNGKKLLVAAAHDDDDLISHHLVRSICVRLNISPEVFGLHLD